MTIRKPVEGADFEGRRRRKMGREDGEGARRKRDTLSPAKWPRRSWRVSVSFSRGRRPIDPSGLSPVFRLSLHTGGGGTGYMIVVGVLLVSRPLFFFLFFPPPCNIDVGCGRIFDRFDSFDSFIREMEFLSRLD